jgi:hypothetical protein
MRIWKGAKNPAMIEAQSAKSLGNHQGSAQVLRKDRRICRKATTGQAQRQTL